MNKSPVVCFYKDDQYIYSLDYELVQSKKDQTLIHFLEQIQNQFSQKMKIVQVDFETKSTIHIFILNSYEIKHKNDFTQNTDLAEILFKTNITKTDFIHTVKKIKHDISQGRYYQVNFTSSFSSLKPHRYDTFDLFKHYLHKFNSKFPAYLPLTDDLQILCYSPELFLSKNDSVLNTQPIKGSSKVNENFDLLINDQKENAELSMIVDLLRNDLQSVCNNQVTVKSHRKKMALNYMIHTFSEIEGTTHLKCPEILSNMLPAGSISGCPKTESLIAIKEYEISKRGFYTGCIGWWEQDDFQFNLAIRSFLNNKHNLNYYSGCGIVYDSDPEKEWQEFNNKAGLIDIIKIWDAFKISETENELMSIHQQRTFEAIRTVNTKITFDEVRNIYDQIPKILESEKKCRLEINPFDLSDVKIEYQNIIPLPKIINVSVSKYKNQKSGLGLQNFKTNQRQYWNQFDPAQEIIGLNTDGFLTETARFNLFIKANDIFYTPDLNSGCINGCLRESFVNNNQIKIGSLTYPLFEKKISLSDLIDAEIYLGNSLRGLIKVNLIQN